MEILSKIWSYFATNILQQPAFMIGFIVLIGYILLQRPWYDILAGTIKAIVGYLILTVGSGGLVNNFRPVLVVWVNASILTQQLLIRILDRMPLQPE